MRLALIALLALIATPALAADHAGHARWHHIYKQWLTPSGTSCCNERDCAPGLARVTASGVEVEIDGRWTPVPADRVRPYNSPDLNDHICRIGPHVLCVVLGGGV